MRSAMMVEFHVYHGDSLIVVYSCTREKLKYEITR
jgi:hypothetical protein